MTTVAIALAISFLSLVIAAVSLGWNIYRDVVLKPKLRVAISVAKVIREPHGTNLDRVLVTVTNFGPGKTRAEMLTLRPQYWRWLLRKPPRYAVVLYDYQDPLSGRRLAASHVS